VITILPTKSYLEKVKTKRKEEVVNLKPLTLRIIRSKLGEEEFILLTSLLDTKKYPTNSIIKLYKARWEVENYYRDEKMWLTIEEFMSESVLDQARTICNNDYVNCNSSIALY
jgi:hypothetical protein